MPESQKAAARLIGRSGWWCRGGITHASNNRQRGRGCITRLTNRYAPGRWRLKRPQARLDVCLQLSIKCVACWNVVNSNHARYRAQLEVIQCYMLYVVACEHARTANDRHCRFTAGRFYNRKTFAYVLAEQVAAPTLVRRVCAHQAHHRWDNIHLATYCCNGGRTAIVRIQDKHRDVEPQQVHAGKLVLGTKTVIPKDHKQRVMKPRALAEWPTTVLRSGSKLTRLKCSPTP